MPRVKTLDEFEFGPASKASVTQIRELADGGDIARTESVVLIGDGGTGKTNFPDRFVRGRLSAETACALYGTAR